MIDNELLVHLWNCGSSLKSAVKYAEHKGVSKQDTVRAFRQFSHTYGYSGSIPIKRELARRPYADDWKDIGNGIQYSKRLSRYYKEGKVRDERSAQWAGWVGVGAQLKEIIRNSQ